MPYVPERMKGGKREMESGPKMAVTVIAGGQYQFVSPNFLRVKGIKGVHEFKESLKLVPLSFKIPILRQKLLNVLLERGKKKKKKVSFLVRWKIENMGER